MVEYILNFLHREFELVQQSKRQSKRFVPGSLVGIKDIDFVGRSEAETP
jgi:hypothetical protein